MADISIRVPNCDNGERGKRGKRGKRGHADSSSGGLLKFSGRIGFDPDLAFVSFLPDSGTDDDGPLSILPLSYPIAVARSLRNMAARLEYVVQSNQSVLVELVQNQLTVPVVIASILYGPGESQIKSVVFGPTLLAIGDTVDLRVTATNVNQGPVILSATVGVE